MRALRRGRVAGDCEPRREVSALVRPVRWWNFIVGDDGLLPRAWRSRSGSHVPASRRRRECVVVAPGQRRAGAHRIAATCRPPAWTGSSRAVQPMPPPKHPLMPFVDELAVPTRRVVSEPARLVVRLEAAVHRFHQISRRRGSGPQWICSRSVRRGQTGGSSRCAGRTTHGPLPVVVTVAPEYAVDGVPAQCLPGRSGGVPDRQPPRSPLAVVPPRRDDAGHQRRLDGETSPPPARWCSTRIRTTTTCGDAVVPRPRDGRDAIQCLRRSRGSDRARRARARARAARSDRRTSCHCC